MDNVPLTVLQQHINFLPSCVVVLQGHPRLLSRGGLRETRGFWDVMASRRKMRLGRVA